MNYKKEIIEMIEKLQKQKIYLCYMELSKRWLNTKTKKKKSREKQNER